MGEYVPPQGARDAARRGLKLVAAGKAGKGFEPATAARARKIAEGKPLTLDHVKRMHSFFSRHKNGRSKTAPSSKVTPWDVAQLAWGGKPAAAWSAKIAKSNKNN